MNICRTCLRTPASKKISELANSVTGNNTKHGDVMKFCLDIQVTPDSKITNVCDSCFRKIVSFYNFKSTSLQNDKYLNSMTVVQSLDQKLTVYVDGNSVKSEKTEELDLNNGDYEYPDTEMKVEIDIMRDLDFESQLQASAPVEEKKKECVQEKSQVEKEAPTSKEQVPKPKRIMAQRIIQPVLVTAGKQRVLVKTPCEGSISIKTLVQMREEVNLSKSLSKTLAQLAKPQPPREPVQCKGCPKKFSSQDACLRHYKFTHLGLKAKCDICDKEYSPTGLSAHKLRKHNPAALRFPCAQCPRRCASQTQLERHMIIHTSARPFKCDVCHKDFNTKTIMGKHIRQVHLNERNFQCEICPKGFFEKQALREHLRTHTRELQYKCEECGKEFWLKSSLRLHRVCHSTTRNHQCQLCNRTFLRGGSLKAHMFSHTKEKPFPCRHCDTRFTNNWHRKRHELRMHARVIQGLPTEST